MMPGGMTLLALEVLLKATVALGAGALATSLLPGRRSAAARHLTWFTTLCACLTIAGSAVMLPSWDWAVPLTDAREAAASPTTAPAGSAGVSALVWQLIPAEGATVSSAGTGTTRGPEALVLAVWGAGALALLLRIIIGALAARRLARSARPVLDGRTLHVLAAARRALDLRRSVRLVWGPVGAAPATFGTRVPHVLLPPDAHQWSEERLRLVLLHELAHVARRDCATQVLADAARAVLWVHPGIWWAATRLREDREQACDEAVLGASGVQPGHYAAELLQIVREHAPLRPAVAVSMAAGTRLERRVRAILNGPPARVRSPMGTRAPAATVAATCAAAVALGCLSPVRSDAARAETVRSTATVSPQFRSDPVAQPESPAPPAPAPETLHLPAADVRLAFEDPVSPDPALTCWAQPGPPRPPRMVVQITGRVRDRTWLRLRPDPLAAEALGGASIATADGGMRCWKSYEVGVGLTGEWGPGDVAELLHTPGARVVLKSPAGAVSEVPMPATAGAVLCEVTRAGSDHAITCSAQSP